ncbi:MAG: hypothetical protein IJ180_10630 [Bacteroidales bacterium]|nr:hypothetical protein [Bacteroidales bacterium]
MKKKIFLLSAFLFAVSSFSTLKAQDFVKDSVSILSEGKTMGERMVIHQGETKKLVGYISLVSKEKAEGNSEVKYAKKSADYLLEKINNDMEKLPNGQSTTKISSDDTLFVQADSIVLERLINQEDNGLLYDANFVHIYADGEDYKISSATTTRNKNGESFLSLKSKGETNGALGDVFDEVVDVIDVLSDMKSSKGYTSKANRKMSSGFVFGYSYLNWSDDGLYSTPEDNYSLKWSDKWDIFYRLTFFPDNVFSFSTGIGLQSNVFRFEDGFDIYPYTVSTPTTNYSKEKCKLVARYVTVPLIAKIKLSNNIAIQVGAIGGLNYRNSHTGFKRTFKTNGEKIEQSTGSSFKDFNNFKADVLLGIDVYGWTFYASHTLTNMFKNSYEKDMKPFSFGVMLGL